MRPPRDPIGLVEAAYDLDGDDDAWLRRLVSCAAPDLGDGLGVAGFYFDASDPGALRWTEPQVAGASGPMRAAIELANRSLPPELVATLYGSSPPLCSGSGLTGLGAGFEDFPPAKAVGHPHGAHDLLALKVLDPDGRGLLIVAPRRGVTSVGARSARDWARVGAHLAAANRLRRTLAGASPLEGAEAVLDDTGRCLDAESSASTRPAREALRSAVLAMEGARGGLRETDPSAAVELWRGLVAGRWTLLEHFESDGRRYLVARRNDPDAPDPRALSFRERQVVGYAALGYPTGLIAYTLGLAPATVSTQLGKALRKLGLRSRGELVQALGPLARATRTDSNS